MYTKRQWKEDVFTHIRSADLPKIFNLTFMGPPWSKVREWNGGNNVMGLERVLYQEWNRIHMAVGQRPISNIIRRCVAG